MSSTPRLLEGYIEPEEITALRRKVERLEYELNEARTETAQARKELVAVSRGLGKLRHQLEPLYNALRATFGELDAAGIVGDVQPGTDARVAGAWEKWKQNMPGKRAEFIQALLDHGAMTGTQLRIATHTAAGSVAGIIHELKKAGLINKSADGRYSLKEL